jgi:hypothetical protein
VKAVCGHKVRISCTDSQYCTGKSVVVEVTNACPHSHPCNIASGHCVGRTQTTSIYATLRTTSRRRTNQADTG